LLIENLDRLSRQKIWDAVELLRSILRAGIIVVELHGGSVLTEQNVNSDIRTILNVVLQFVLANAESEKKSLRLKEVWGERRDRAANGVKVACRGPAWLKDGQPIPERVATIHMLFELYLSGYGVRDIIKQLNANPIVWHPKEHYKNKDGRWCKNYADKVLSDRRLIGERQWKKMVDGKSQPVGDPVPNYFPVVIDPDLFHRAQAMRTTRSAFSDHGGGANGANRNLFRRLVRCAVCGEPMKYYYKGRRGPNLLESEFLQCERVHSGLSCVNKKPIRYDKLEPILLYHMKGLDGR
jgi:DNA invertase Pin-like site-specific DNA recombinase